MVHFADFVQNLKYEEIPQEALGLLRRSFADTLSVAAVGTTTEMSAIARKTANLFWRGASEAGEAAMLFDGRLVSPAGAAMAGAFTVDSIDAHDGTTPCKGHAGSSIFPAIIALTDSLARRGKPVAPKELACALVTAYEVAYRSGLMLHATATAYHTSGAWTSVGVAAGAARLLGLDREGIRHAVGIADYHAPRCEMMRVIDNPTMLRDGVGWGSPSGLTAALMAELGFTGAPAEMTEGEAAAPYWQDLGQSWRFIEDTHYKRYPVCRWAHPSIDAARELMVDNNLASADVKAITIETFHYATRLARPNPKTLDEMTYSIIFPVAVMIARGKLGVAELSEEVLTDAEIRRLSDATTMVDSDYYTRISVAKRWAGVTLHLTDGRELKSDPKTPKGDRDDPLSDGEMHHKFMALTDGLLSDERRTTIERLALNFDTGSQDELAQLIRLSTTPLDEQA